ncbi:glycosyltransferase [Flagellimonas meridianipacifica]|uniref:Glycosyltransferase involved in cell wall biosynthesis n=1 Tax=Flagellimonas meridianipacifica TaxID=1080225 RepID=A0A2T0MBZ1_9FLAO|nr:glycosyltransferase [Allomuricauda pacifica]PRX55017.1 glycosyltransferase involved in cell wall biosynthesis [Allomuricauda pacifica]
MSKVLIIGHHWPEPTTTAAGHRMVQLIEAFSHFGWSVTFVSTASKTEYSLNLKKLGVETASIQLNHFSFDDFIKELNPQYVVFDRFMVEEQFGWRVAEHAPKAIQILNTEDLHSLRKTREAYHKKGEEFTLEKWKGGDITKREIASIYRSDLSLMISKFEMITLLEELQIPENLLMHLPFMMEEVTKTTQAKWPSFKERKDFITYGNGKHKPNVDAIIYLKETIWPLIREKLPKADLKVYGAYLPQQIKQMHAPQEGFHVLGWIENLDVEIQKARIVLAPLRFGAGIKGKITDALKNGTPVVTTKIGEEGMSLNLPSIQSVENNDPKTFMDCAVQLYSTRELWCEAQKQGLESINVQYSKTKHQQRLQKTLEGISESILKHRNENFIGALLQHQSMVATKYMGKWIEEKNRG